ncbi:Uncharacterised protein [Legionella maceachernii]|nr:hypothetical protein SAMN02745128_02561 [Legionella maceachernii]SUP02661.1 Uncharacterised protein [Legionella maceachernii]
MLMLSININFDIILYKKRIFLFMVPGTQGVERFSLTSTEDITQFPHLMR